MAASMICTRTFLCAPYAPTGAAVASFFSSPSASLDGVKVVAARRRLCALQEGVRGLWRTQSRTIGFRNAAGSAQIKKKRGEPEQCNGVLVRAKRGDRGSDSNRDEDGVIKDMELYLDDLSLEYESVWDTKPAWCQPWSIVTTGLAVVGGSWLSFQNIVVSGGACFLVGFWWFSFLYAYPMAYTEMIAERRKNVKNGSEDTFGTRRVQ